MRKWWRKWWKKQPPGDIVITVPTGRMELTMSDVRVIVPGGLPAGKLTTNATFHSIGLKWDCPFNIDTDHNATMAVQYRKVGSNTWKNAMNLMRCEYEWWYDETPPTNNGLRPWTRADQATNAFTGSIMFLTPGTLYEIQLTYTDPQSTDDARIIDYVQVRTRAYPRKPVGGTTYYVESGHGGTNSGTSDNPWTTIATANSNVSPGDIVRIRTGSGSYPATELNTSGEEDNYIVYEADSGNTPVLDRLAIDGHHLWLDNLTFTWDGDTTNWRTMSGVYVPVLPATEPDDVVITRCTFNDYSAITKTGDVVNTYSGGGINVLYAISRWIVMDNVVSGPCNDEQWNTTDSATGGPATAINVGGEGNPGGTGCVVAYNSINGSGDGIAFGKNALLSECDVYGNEIKYCMGNAISPDESGANNRVWGNKVSNCRSYPLSFQPQNGSPWYFLYNQIVDMYQFGNLKWRVQDRIVFINNTFAGRNVWAAAGQHIMRSFSRNNLWLKESSILWGSKDTYVTDSPNFYRDSVYDADWFTDIDYDGVDVAGGVILRWDNDTNNYSTFADVYTNVGIWQNGITVDADSIFVNKDYGDTTNYTYPAVDLLLASGTNAAVNAGQKVNNLADWYANNDTVAPDLGCHNRTDGAPHYGQRTSELSLPLHQRTVDWIKH